MRFWELNIPEGLLSARLVCDLLNITRAELGSLERTGAIIRHSEGAVKWHPLYKREEILSLKQKLEEKNHE